MQPLKVLIADDFHPFLAGLKRILQQHKGYEVVGQAGDGLEAILAARYCKPDIVFLDISMPTVSGFEAARRIRDEAPATRIVIVTAHHEETYRALGEILNVDGYVLKSELKTDLPVLLDRLQQGPRASEEQTQDF